jgi:hypothetical protein
MPRHEKTTETQPYASSGGGHGREGDAMSYLRFGAMIATSMVVMYAVMYLHTYELAHVRWSETRLFMTLLMGSAMAMIMLGFMLGMYKNRRVNVAIVAGSLILFGLGTWLLRSQTTVQGTSWMSAMIPHHSIAILTSERAEIEDVRVCRLAVEIIEAQRREISEMEWLIDDIVRNGAALTSAAAAQRPTPDFGGTSARSCP